jgi:hypothetical protein
MADPSEPDNFNKRVTSWALLQVAAARDAQDLSRSYDRRYHHPELTHERVRAEAALAAALVREYTDPSAIAAEDSAPARDPRSHA